MDIPATAREIRDISQHTLTFARGYRQMRRTHETPVDAYRSMRILYCMTNGRFNDGVSWMMSRAHPPSRVPAGQSILGDISDGAVARVVEDIDNNGYHVFDQKLPQEIVAKLKTFAETTPCKATAVKGDPTAARAEELSPYRSHPAESPRYDFGQRDILGNPAVQDLLMDSGLRRVAQAFLRCDPILDLLAMWWSRPYHGKASTEAAQLYHFDMDRIKFLKFFFYLTDVTSETGPHCYVRGSSKRKPAPILRDGRISDEEIASHYPKADLVEICGGTGSIIAVDTRGWHKGKALTERERLLLQFEYTNSMFGQNYPRTHLPQDTSPAFAEFVQRNPRMFQGIVD